MWGRFVLCGAERRHDDLKTEIGAGDGSGFCGGG